jgi:16S rRNA (uracil1498-N3)-methyltransferase
MPAIAVGRYCRRMPDADFTSTRLFVDGPLTEGTIVPLRPDQRNYLKNVLRFSDGGALRVFDGRSGEWRARYHDRGKRDAEVTVEAQMRPQPAAGDLWYLFAPLKHARLDYMVQKATEMGVSRLMPVTTHHTQVHRLNLDRMRANAIEAAEQCGVLSVPDIAEPMKLGAVLHAWQPSRRLIFCDEGAVLADPLATLATVPRGPLAVLVGPEGGFDAAERRQLAAAPFTTVLTLGPRILRADTAAVAALALVQASCGDWRGFSA